MKILPNNNVTRFEVIDHRNPESCAGRVMVEYGVNVELSLQDDGRTLKVFLTEQKKAKHGI